MKKKTAWSINFHKTAQIKEELQFLRTTGLPAIKAAATWGDKKEAIIWLIFKFSSGYIQCLTIEAMSVTRQCLTQMGIVSQCQ